MGTQARALRQVCLLVAVVFGGGGAASLMQTASGAPLAQTGWTLAWSDEFNGPTIDLSTWSYEPPRPRPENGELQYYTERPKNARIEQGQLLIEGHPESYAGYAYTSASLHTNGKRFFGDGRIEMRAKLPYSKGAWPAFWTMGPHNGCWPNNGEIDIMELVGGDNRDNQVHAAAHWSTDLEGCNTAHISRGGSYTLPAGIFADGYHTFAIERDATHIRWFMDGLHYYTLNISTAEQSELRQPHFLLLNLAIGGHWPGAPDANSRFPMQYFIDYVRYYTPPNPTPPSLNDLSNPDLESGTAGWNALGGSWSIGQPGAGNTSGGSAAFVMSTTQPYGSGTGPYQQIGVVPRNTDYVASFWLKGSGNVRMTVNNDGWEYIGGAHCNATSTWTPCSFAFNTGSNTGLIIQMQDHGAGTAYLDDLYLGPPRDRNQLTNPGLESGNANWNAVGSSWSIGQPGAGKTHTGNWAFVMSTTQPYGSGTGPYQAVTDVPTNTDYVARFWLKGSGRVQIVVYNGTWGYIGTTACDATSTWTPCSFAFNTGSNTSLIVQVQDHAAGTAYVDDLYLGTP
ncbi:MAG TPA: family 16 glycosylhydrolase [Herpetosiphonaceae bacterium]